MSLITSDENQTLILTGTFGEFNSKGVWINDSKGSLIFKEYSKILAVSFSKRIHYLDMIKYFDLTPADRTKEYLNELTNIEDPSQIEVCARKYIDENFNPSSAT